MTMRRIAARVLVVLLTTLLGTGIVGHGSTSTAGAAPGLDAGWRQEAVGTVDLIQGISGMAGLARATSSELHELRRSTDDVIMRAPRAELRTDGDDVLLRQVTAARPFQALVDEVDIARASFSSDAADAAASATPDQRVRARLTENGREILHDVACEAAYRSMTPEEAVEVDEVDWRPYVRDLDVEPVAGAIVRYAQRSVSGFFGREAVRLVRWDHYGQRMAEKISTFDEGLGGTVHNPDPNSMFVFRTTASVYYARTCLLPPR
jgi:hypothetical protein